MESKPFAFHDSFMTNIPIPVNAGADRLMADIEHMVGFKLGKHWYICWKFISPTLLIVSTEHSSNSVITFDPSITYNAKCLGTSTRLQGKGTH